MREATPPTVLLKGFFFFFLIQAHTSSIMWHWAIWLTMGVWENLGIYGMFNNNMSGLLLEENLAHFAKEIGGSTIWPLGHERL